MDYYNKISNGYNELYEEEQLKKLNLIAKIIESLRITVNGKRILDVGCGTGISTAFFHCDVGADSSKELLKIARKKYPKIKFINAKAEELPFLDGYFDGIISITAIQNFSDIEKGLLEIKRVGREFFILTFLKKSQKRELIENLIRKLFKIKKRIEEEKDIIFICTK